ncbi:hypothetical protein LINPERPRIM_LOCUS27982 [Linum perenne]
MPRNEFSFT